MTNDERKVLLNTLESLDVTVVDTHVYSHTAGGTVDLYNYRAIGKMVVAKRMIAELLGIPHKYLMSGENWDEEEIELDATCRFATPSVPGEPLTRQEKQWLIDTVLVVLNGIGGLNDGDEACLRVATRRIAEVAGYPDLSHYRLLGEHTVKPIYFRAYQLEQV